MNKLQVEARIKELEKENENLQIKLIRGDTVRLEEKALSFSYNGKTARVSIDISTGDIRINADENTISIVPESHKSFYLKLV